MIDDFESMRWDPPCILELRIYEGIDGMNVSEREGYINIAPHILTPRNSSSSHYFWASGIKNSESTVSDKEHFGLVGMAFDQEDAPMLEAVQKRIGENSDILSLKPKPTSLPGDAANIQARRILKKLIKSESTK